MKKIVIALAMLLNFSNLFAGVCDVQNGEMLKVKGSLTLAGLCATYDMYRNKNNDKISDYLPNVFFGSFFMSSGITASVMGDLMNMTITGVSETFDFKRDQIINEGADAAAQFLATGERTEDFKLAATVLLATAIESEGGIEKTEFNAETMSDKALATEIIERSLN